MSPFDFLVGGEILRTSLSEWCVENEVGEVCIYYLFLKYIQFFNFFFGWYRKKLFRLSTLNRLCRLKKCRIFHMKTGYHLSPANWKSQFFWSCTKTIKKNINRTCSYFLTASYDGQIRVFDYSKILVSNSVLHPAPITSLCIISSNDEFKEGSYTIATSSHDLTTQLSQFTIRPSSMDTDNNNTPSTSISTSKSLASLHLHTAPVSSVSSNSTGTHLLTSSWDGLIGLWDTSIPLSDEVQEPELNERDRKKKKKTRRFR
jgi:ribosome biogenesis protein